MDAQVVRALRENVDAMKNTLTTVASTFGIDPKLPEVAVFQLGTFMMFLSAVDGEIDMGEAQAISDITGLPVKSPAALKQFIVESDIFGDDFITTVPIALQVAVMADNALYDNGKRDLSLSAAIIKTYEQVGAAMAHADGNVSDIEAKGYAVYMTMMQNYRNENYKGA